MLKSRMVSICRRLAFLFVPVGVLTFFLLQGNALGENVEANHFLRLDFAPENESQAESAGGKFFLTFSGKVRGKIRREVGIPLFYIDILGAAVDVSPLITPFQKGPARLVRLTQVSQEPPVVRATFFLRSLYSPKVRLLNNGLEVAFDRKEPEILPPGGIPLGDLSLAGLPPEKSGKPVPYALMTPEPLRSSPASAVISLDLQNAEAGTLLRELAHQAGLTLHAQMPLDTPIDITATASSPLEALNIVAAKLGAQVSVNDDEVWISNTLHPLAAFSDSDFVQGADLRGLEVGDVLRALGQMANLNVVLDPSMATVKDRPVEILLTRMSFRQAVDTILKMYNLSLRAIDPKTILVLTEKEARRSAESVFRIVNPQTNLKKVLEILKTTLPPGDLEKISFKEDLGNLIVVGEKDPVERSLRLIDSIEGKMKKVGEGISREFYKAVNTKPADLIKLIGDTLGEDAKPKITEDERNDTLIVSGAKEVVDRTIGLLKQLDRPPTPQALIYIRLVELHHTDLERLGLQFTADHIGVPDIGNVRGALALPAQLDFLEQNSRVKTLANPTLRCMDKEESSIDISEQIPVKNTVTNYLPVASSSLAAQTSDNWTTSDIGIKLKLKPLIHEDKQVTMEVNVDFTELVKMVEGHPWTAKRNVKTKVRIKDRESVVIGGLIRRKDDRTNKPIPFLNRIPLLKWLARTIDSKERNQEETEMVLVITPAIVGPGNIENPERRALRPPTVSMALRGDARKK